MARKSATHLEGDAFAQAQAVLDRAQPSPIQDQLFRLLWAAVWTAVTLTALYLAVRFRWLPAGDDTRWLARGIAGVYIGIVPLFAANWRLVVKLWRAARARRALSPSFRKRLADRFKLRRRKGRFVNILTLMLSAGGAVIAGGASLGLLLEVIAGAPLIGPRAAVFGVLAIFGVSCMFLHFMARGRERLYVLAELRASLLASRDADDQGLSPADYDEITRIERGQISADRRRSGRPASVRLMHEGYASKEHRTIRDVKLALAPETLVKVQACIDALTRQPHVVAAATRDGISYLHVPGTPLEIGFQVDEAAREIRLLSLAAVPPTAARPGGTVET